MALRPGSPRAATCPATRCGGLPSKFGARDLGSGSISVKLHVNDGGNPGAVHANVSGPSTPSNTDAQMHCNGCTLAANTTYHLALAAPSAQRTRYFRWRGTNSDGQTNNPTTAGWTIADKAGRQDRHQSSQPWTKDASENVGLFSLLVPPGGRRVVFGAGGPAGGGAGGSGIPGGDPGAADSGWQRGGQPGQRGDCGRLGRRRGGHRLRRGVQRRPRGHLDPRGHQPGRHRLHPGRGRRQPALRHRRAGGE